MFIKLRFMLVLVLLILIVELNINNLIFLPFPKDGEIFANGLINVIVLKSVCNQPTKYGIPVFNILEKANKSVVLSHQKYTKPQKGNKTDRKDTKWMCDLFMCDMIKPSFFPTSKHLISWTGCCPRNDQSNIKIKSTRISHAGTYFKSILVQIANGLFRSKKHPKITNRYKRIKICRGHKKAIIAVSLMLLTAIGHILSKAKPYTAEGFLKHGPVNESKVLTTAQTITLLK